MANLDIEAEENKYLGAVAEVAWTGEDMAAENPITEHEVDADTTAF